MVKIHLNYSRVVYQCELCIKKNHLILNVFRLVNQSTFRVHFGFSLC